MVSVQIVESQRTLTSDKASLPQKHLLLSAKITSEGSFIMTNGSQTELVPLEGNAGSLLPSRQSAESPRVHKQIQTVSLLIVFNE